MILHYFHFTNWKSFVLCCLCGRKNSVVWLQIIYNHIVVNLKWFHFASTHYSFQIVKLLSRFMLKTTQETCPKQETQRDILWFNVVTLISLHLVFVYSLPVLLVAKWQTLVWGKWELVRDTISKHLQLKARKQFTPSY